MERYWCVLNKIRWRDSSSVDIRHCVFDEIFEDRRHNFVTIETANEGENALNIMSVVKVMMLKEPEFFHKIHEYEIHNNSTIRRTDQCREQVNRL